MDSDPQSSVKSNWYFEYAFIDKYLFSLSFTNPSEDFVQYLMKTITESPGLKIYGETKFYTLCRLLNKVNSPYFYLLFIFWIGEKRPTNVRTHWQDYRFVKKLLWKWMSSFTRKLYRGSWSWPLLE